MSKIFLVMIGGSLGALCRYGLALLAVKVLGSSFPWGTLLANLTGCFLIGISFALVDRTNLLSPGARLLFMTGFLGALTTFSTFALETVSAINSGANFVGLTYFLANNLGGGGLVVAGIWLTRTILRGD